MTCTETREFLQDHFTSDGISLSEAVRGHIDSCVGCKAFYDELAGLGSTLAPLTELQLTAEEAAEMSAAISRQMTLTPMAVPEIRTQRMKEGKIFSIARILLAAAAVFLMVVISSSPTQYDLKTAVVDEYSGIQYLSVNEYDIAILLDDNANEILPSYVDQTSAAYLASQLQPGQVDYLIESLTDEDIAWIEANFAVEI
ncbi:MAG: hypothetical protein R3F48_07420 [Candidatus Zixiibacteriota bacterium]